LAVGFVLNKKQLPILKAVSIPQGPDSRESRLTVDKL